MRWEPMATGKCSLRCQGVINLLSKIVCGFNTMIRTLFTALLLMMSAICYAGGQPAAGELRMRMGDLDSLSADFEQTVYAAEGDLVQQASGHMLAARPGRVRWNTDAPLEQLIVTNGKTLWLYDPDLEQVTIKPFDADLGKTPAVLFIGDLVALEDSYTVSLEEEGMAALFTLVPNKADSLYEKVTLRFDGLTPVAMALWDTLGQKTDIHFDNFQRNPSWSVEQFEFIPPDGVDIIGDE
ncbi:MAG: outer membrane lipoprotein chaperone LolA [Gammaproteobacteria bacterium]|nr:MAG: outer membrane lipoprotein chaperone LolA [Gammaproteobacteria bacterium]